ncbi:MULTISPECIES: YlqD family protein [Metabacillus]|uniref:YlqD family protein n=1 Tax=Metabacillus hrfriensis TaxID=3048891 RepID=A0ACD4RH60_9BACI|nr:MULTISPECIES: YlqD family protein [Metabacillus]UAL54234.1 YlqD family protein [Metabacillus dongyingensis]USK30555.1 YlqD family protein [Bacillus sp. CMF21]WHZ59804.1 YlqD family protein [Metabacillus sp. CT-WN-B3]
MEIFQTVSVKQILTETSREQLLNHFMQTKQQLEREIDQLAFQLKKKEKTNQTEEMRKQYQREISKRMDKIKIADFQIQQIHTLPLGSEIKEKEMNAILEVHVGDRWDDLIKEKTIVIKDGIVVEIR